MIGGFPEQAGAAWCLPCCDAAGLKTPTVLRARYAGDNTNTIRAEWLERKAAEKREKLAAFLESRKAKTAPPAAAAPTIVTAPAPTSAAGQMRLI